MHFFAFVYDSEVEEVFSDEDWVFVLEELFLQEDFLSYFDVFSLDDVFVPQSDVFLWLDELFFPLHDVLLSLDDVFVPLQDVFFPLDDVFDPLDDVFVPLQDVLVPLDDVFVPVLCFVQLVGSDVDQYSEESFPLDDVEDELSQKSQSQKSTGTFLHPLFLPHVLYSQSLPYPYLFPLDIITPRLLFLNKSLVSHCSSNIL